ncbi:MAG TPA: ergothioneine biosynthesis protein EgtB [Polyangiaceae bacterium]|jgi:ergothioneine biosynthesis protein EgtB
MAPRAEADGRVDLAAERDRLSSRFLRTRARTEALAAPLSPEDQQLQSMPDASPAKWHRAHTTWFFETFVLLPAGGEVVDRRYDYLFNSYYDAVGPRHARSKRGLLSRPTAAEVGDYRRIVDERMARLLATAGAEGLARALPVVELGIAHEEQHQELLLTDILHAFWENPLHPAYQPEREREPRAPARASSPEPIRFLGCEGGLVEVGAREPSGFAFDNERPRHKRWVEPFELGDRLVTVRELRAFLDADGYRTPSLWLSEGLDFVRARDLASPLYTAYRDGELHAFGLTGTRVAGDDEPVAHLSFYEADALARFLGARLPTEAEWEVFAEECPVRGHFAGSGVFHPLPAPPPTADARGARQLFGDAWEWTQSSYEPYPGYRQAEGALGEYNGKFMVNQLVLRGGSCFTPEGHVRRTYRNFWHAPTQFQMTGVRIARGGSR